MVCGKRAKVSLLMYFNSDMKKRGFSIARFVVLQMRIYNHLQGLNEAPHDKTNKMACAPIEDSDQPGHPPSLIRVFSARTKKAWVLASWVLAGHTVILLVLS